MQKIICQICLHIFFLYRKAIELHPIYDQAMNNLANILRDLEQLDEAKYLLLKAVELR